MEYDGVSVLLSQDRGQDMKWTPHITKVAKKVNGILGFLRRNLRTCPSALKETAYGSLVRSITEYSSTIWDPILKKNINLLEAVQETAAKFVTGNYINYTTGSMMVLLDSLRWQSLENRREVMIMQASFTFLR